MKPTVKKGYKICNKAIHLNGLCLYSRTVRESYREQARYACMVFTRVRRHVNQNILLGL